MACPRKMVADILNNCVRPVRGNKPLAYWQYRSQITLTLSDNEITAISTMALGSLESAKFGIDAGHEVAVSDIAEDAYKHKFSGIFTNTSEDLDTMEDIVVFVESNAGTWSCYGAEQGLWKESQIKMSNDNLSTVAVEFGSREGQEEKYSEYVVAAALIDAIPKTTEYEFITGLSLADGSITPQTVYLQVDSDKTCKVILPDNTVLTSTAGVIDTTWAGAAGDVTLIVPKDTAETYLQGGDYVGDLDAIFYGGILDVAGCANLTSVTVDNISSLTASGCPSLISVYSPGSAFIDCFMSALTADAIAIQLAIAMGFADLSMVNYDFSGGTNAAHSTWSAQAQADAAAIVLAGGTVTYTA